MSVAQFIRKNFRAGAKLCISCKCFGSIVYSGTKNNIPDDLFKELEDYYVFDVSFSECCEDFIIDIG